ncbi:phosphoribosyltransferase [soil metagenome]
MTPHFTEATTDYWQRIVDADTAAASDTDPPWRHGYPARLPDGRVLVLPIRQLASEPTHAVASLICNQASLEVIETLGRMLAERLAPFKPDVVVGIPTLGLTFAPVVARHLGHARYVPMGYSRKFWYDEALSGAVQSITTPTPGKRVYLDPNLLPLVQGKRVVLVDDAVSSGSTLKAPWTLMEDIGAEVLACGVAMLQGHRWKDTLGADRAARMVGVFESPLLQAVPDGWVERA